MISRRLIRIKALQSVYSYRKNEEQNFVNCFKEYQFSIHKSYEFYLLLLQMLVEIKHYSYLRIDQIKNRVIKDEKEWKRLVRLANNRVFLQLESNQQFQSLVRNEKISLSQQQFLIKEIFTEIVNSDTYEAYLLTEDTYEADKKLVRKIVNTIILQTENLYNFLEESSIYWNDEEDYIISMVEKTIKSFTEKNREGGEISLIYKDEELHDFAKKILSESVNRWSEFNEFIDANLKNWDQERVAEIDIIILQIAVTEAVLFSEIPIRVTLNEYIEIAKLYSTDKSGLFINGMLHTILEQLKDKKIIVKKGRGLI